MSVDPLPGGPVDNHSSARSHRSRSSSRVPPVSPEGHIGLAWGEVKLAEHDPNWTCLFEEEKAALKSTLGESLRAIEHVGSTSVPGLAAKPIIDIAISVDSLANLEDLARRLRTLDYDLRPDITIPGEAFFLKTAHTYHLHVLEHDSDHWQNYLTFRNYLRTHPPAARKYIRLKRRLAAKFANNRAEYTRGKAEFIEALLEEARNQH